MQGLLVAKVAEQVGTTATGQGPGARSVETPERLGQAHGVEGASQGLDLPKLVTSLHSHCEVGSAGPRSVCPALPPQC